MLVTGRIKAYPARPWVGASSWTALLLPRVAQRAEKNRHRSKREQGAPVSRRDTRDQQPERRGEKPMQGGRPHVVAEGHPAEKAGRVVGGQERGPLPRRDQAHKRGDPAVPARHPEDRGDHAREGGQVDPTVHLWGYNPWKAHSCVFSLRRFFAVSTAADRKDETRSRTYHSRSVGELCWSTVKRSDGIPHQSTTVLHSRPIGLLMESKEPTGGLGPLICSSRAFASRVAGRSDRAIRPTGHQRTGRTRPRYVLRMLSGPLRLHIFTPGRWRGVAQTPLPRSTRGAVRDGACGLRRTPAPEVPGTTLPRPRVRGPYERRHPTTSGAPLTSKPIPGGST